MPVKDRLWPASISAAMSYKRKTVYEGMEISEMRRMRLLEDENASLNEVVAQQALDSDALKVALAKKAVGSQCGREAVRIAREEGRLSDTPAKLLTSNLYSLVIG